MKKNRELFMKFNKKTDRLDDFFFNKVCGLDEYPLIEMHQNDLSFDSWASPCRKGI